MGLLTDSYHGTCNIKPRLFPHSPTRAVQILFSPMASRWEFGREGGWVM